MVPPMGSTSVGRAGICQILSFIQKRIFDRGRIGRPEQSKHWSRSQSYRRQQAFFHLKPPDEQAKEIFLHLNSPQGSKPLQPQ